MKIVLATHCAMNVVLPLKWQNHANRLLFIFLCFSPHLLSSQALLEKRVSLQAIEVPISSILDSLATQSGARFAYNKKKVKLDQIGSLLVEDEELGLSLQQLLKRTNIHFSASGNLVSLFSKAPPVFTISGYIRDAQSGEALIGANIYEASTYKGVSTNEYGFFSLSLPTGLHYLRVSFIGYQPHQDTIQLDQHLEDHILLTAGNDLREVTVLPSDQIDDPVSNSQSSLSNGSKIATTSVGANSSILGENDMMKVAQLLPGVISGMEGSSGIHVHGGSHDQNLILLDGVTIYHASHLFGFISIFNSKAINSTTLYKSSFPARFSGRLSSIVDVRMKDGNNQKLQGGFDLGILSGSAYLEGPLKKGKGSFLISGRRTWLDLIAASAQIGNKEVKTNYNFHDFNAKLNWRLSPKNRLFFSWYSGSDRFIDRRTSSDQVFADISETTTFRAGLNWGNRAIALRWNSILSPKLFSNLTLYHGNFNYGLETFANTKEQNPLGEITQVTDELQAGSSIKDSGIKLDLDFLPSYQHHLRFGLGYVLHDFVPGFVEGFFEKNGQQSKFRDGTPPVISHEVNAYIEDAIKLNQKLSIHPGFHFTLIDTDGKSFRLPQFRFKLNYDLKPQQQISLSYAGMAQFVHLLTNTGLGLVTDFWVPSTDRVRPGFAHQFATTYERPLGQQGVAEFSLFYKRMNNLIEYQNGASLINSASNWESRIEIGKGWSYGGTLLLDKQFNRTHARLAYSLIWSNRQFENLNQGKAFPYQYDRRHNLNISLKHGWKAKKKKHKYKDISLLWVLNSGALISVPTEWYFSPDGQVVAHYATRNNYRLPMYHRLDFVKSNHKKSPKGHIRSWKWGVYNLYGNTNPFGATLEFPSAGQVALFTSNSLFAFPIPFIQYQLEF